MTHLPQTLEFIEDNENTHSTNNTITYRENILNILICTKRYTY